MQRIKLFSSPSLADSSHPFCGSKVNLPTFCVSFVWPLVFQIFIMILFIDPSFLFRGVELACSDSVVHFGSISYFIYSVKKYY